MSASRLSCLKDEDREFFDRELSSFLPDRIFDAHTHTFGDLRPWSGARRSLGATSGCRSIST